MMVMQVSIRNFTSADWEKTKWTCKKRVTIKAMIHLCFNVFDFLSEGI